MELKDVRGSDRVRLLNRVSHFKGHILECVVDDLVLVSNGACMSREYIVHDDAVAVVAVRGEDDPEVLLIRQYRHATGCVLWEIPAGLLDISGENPEVAARRELAEETGLAAEQLTMLANFYTSPGCSTEKLTVFLARGLSEVETDFVREDEESEIEVAWVPLRDVLAAVGRGDVASPTLVTGVLAAASRLGITL